MLRVRDIMTRQVLCLRADATVDSAAWSLATGQVSGAPVRDRHGALVGVISRSDLADVLRRSAIPESVRVEEAMTPAVWSVHPDDPALAAVRLMVDKGIHRVLAVRGPGHVDGIVTATDVLRALLRGADFGPIDNLIARATEREGA